MTREEKKTLPLIIGLMLALIVGTIIILSASNNLKKTTQEEVTEEIIVADKKESTEEIKTDNIISHSVEGREIENYTFGQGETHLLFVGGIHGGYEWNSVLLAYKLIDEIENGNIIIPDSLSLNIIPVLNPDGLYLSTNSEGRFAETDATTVTQGRFNANGVDLNRNFDCKWQPTSTWRGELVSAGTSAFSEPEALALKNLVEKKNPKAVIFWHSQANAVYASECENGILSETLNLMDTYAKASGYKPVSTFDAYPISGDAEGWLASIGIPAITVELRTRDGIEWQENKAGVEAVIDYYKTAR